MAPDSCSELWYALQVRARWEHSIATILVGKGYDTFVPTYNKRWSRRLKEAFSPLFPGYVFCRFDATKRLPILVTPGVIAVVGRGRVPVAVEEHEISAIQAIVASGLDAEPWPYIEVGQRVRLEDTALQGMEGILIGFKGSRRIVVSVSLLRRSVALEIDRLQVSPVSSSRGPIADTLSPQHLLDGVIA